MIDCRHGANAGCMTSTVGLAFGGIGRVAGGMIRVGKMSLRTVHNIDTVSNIAAYHYGAVNNVRGRGSYARRR